MCNFFKKLFGFGCCCSKDEGCCSKHDECCCHKEEKSKTTPQEEIKK